MQVNSRFWSYHHSDTALAKGDAADGEKAPVHKDKKTDRGRRRRHGDHTRAYSGPCSRQVPEDSARTTRRRRAPGAAAIPADVRRALGPRDSAGLLIAEGDSWFDYPFNDVLRLLEDDHGYDVESVAHKGDRVEDMAYAGGQFEEFARRLEKLLRNGRVPRAILLSGGGNDIAGEEFAILLNHAASQQAGFNENILRGVIDERIKSAYITIVSAITAVCRNYLGRPIP